MTIKDIDLDSMLADDLPDPQYIIKGPVIKKEYNAIYLSFKLGFVPNNQQSMLQTEYLLQLLEERFGLPDVSPCGIISKGMRYTYAKNDFRYEIELVKDNGISAKFNAQKLTFDAASYNLDHLQKACQVVNAFLEHRRAYSVKYHTNT
jgi:hypothetical protein